MAEVALSVDENTTGTEDPAVKTPPDDLRLHEAFEALSDGETVALETIYGLVSGELFALALWRTGSREDAADAVQDVFVALATTRARLGNVTRPRSYLLRMTHHAAARLARRRHPAEAADELLLPAPGSGPEARALARQAAGCLARLPVRQREVVFLHLVAGLSFREVGSVTGVSRFTAASRYRLGLARLRSLMGVTP
ncbi:MAG: sigma-70 family RNA polymerase sigma factor [Acidobacteria bacterium]|nr:sigma-70 family RNA polymerase sigma factor [Acidobacteriota bacterium]